MLPELLAGNMSISNNKKSKCADKNDLQQWVSGSLVYPALSRRWTTFDHKTDDMVDYVLIKLLIHTGAQESDFVLQWIDEYTFHV